MKQAALKPIILKTMKKFPLDSARRLTERIQSSGHDVSPHYVKDVVYTARKVAKESNGEGFGTGHETPPLRPDRTAPIARGAKVAAIRKYLDDGYVNGTNIQLRELIFQETGLDVSVNTIATERARRKKKKKQREEPAAQSPTTQPFTLSFCPHCGVNIAMLVAALEVSQELPR